MKHRNILIGIAILIVLALVIFTVTKPRIKGDLPDTQDSEYLDFINNNLVGGGPEKDGIPSIDKPIYVSAEEAENKGFVSPDEIVFGIDYNGQVRAYPQSIMYWHEIVNEEFGGEKVSITYCPLTGSIIGYKNRHFGVSGKLYNSNLVLYDRETDSNVPQILGIGIDGPLKGEEFEKVHVRVAKWKDWKAKHPDTLVLSRDLGFDRNYDRNPYPGYDEAYRIWLPVAAESDLFHTKKFVFGVKYNGDYLAIPKEEFKQKGSDLVTLGGEEVKLEYDEKLDIIHAYADGNEIPSIQMYWFAWYAYNPSTKVWPNQI